MDALKTILIPSYVLLIRLDSCMNLNKKYKNAGNLELILTNLIQNRCTLLQINNEEVKGQYKHVIYDLLLVLIPLLLLCLIK